MGSWNFQKAAQRAAADVAKNARNDDHGGGHRRHAPQLLADGDAHGRGNALGQKGGQHSVLHGKNPAEDCHAAQAHRRSRQNAHKDGRQILFQDLYLLVQRHGKAHRSRCQQPGKGFTARRIIVGSHIQDFDCGNHQDHRNEDRIANGAFQLFLQPDAEFIGSQRQDNGKQRSRRQKLIHGTSLPFSASTGSPGRRRRRPKLWIPPAPPQWAAAPGRSPSRSPQCLRQGPQTAVP